MDKQKVTGGTWESAKYVPEGLVDDSPKWQIKLGDNYTTRYITRLTEGDANLIVTAVNACKDINPEHPEYVAEKIGEMYQSLKDVRFMLRLTPMREMSGEPWANKLQAVLNAIEKKEEK